MANLKRAMLGILVALFGIAFLYVSWYMADTFLGMFESTILKGLWWAGAITMIIIGVVIVPYQYISGGDASYKDAVKGILIFVIGSIASAIAYYTIPPIMETMDNVFSSNIIAGIGWFALFIFWIMAMIIVPAYTMLKKGLKGDNQENE